MTVSWTMPRPGTLAALALAAVLAVLLAGQWTRARRAEAAHQAELDRRDAEFQDALAKARNQSEILRAQLEEEKRRGARPVEIFQGTTGPVAVKPGAVVERPCPVAPAPPTLNAPEAPASAPACPAQPVPMVRCALWPDEHPELRAAGAIVAGRKGERRVHLDVSAWGSAPPRKLFEGGISAPVTSEEPLATPPEVRPRFAAEAGVLWDGPPTGPPAGARAGADLRVWDRWWVKVGLHTERVTAPDGRTVTATGTDLGVRREFP